MVKVDVVVSTYNSEQYLDRCLGSIRENVPVQTLWIIDNFSTDKTLDIAKKYDATVVQTDCSLADARTLSFRIVETPLFVNVDSDVVLAEDWFNKMMRYWRGEDLAVLWGMTVESRSYLHKVYEETMLKLRKPYGYRKLPHLLNMIARKQVLEDIQFPEIFRCGSVANEDFWILHWITEVKKKQCQTVPIYSSHYSLPPSTQKTFWGGASGRATHFTSFPQILRQATLAFPQSLFVAVASGEPRVIPYFTRFRMELLYGWLHWNKYLRLVRKKGGETSFQSYEGWQKKVMRLAYDETEAKVLCG